MSLVLYTEVIFFGKINEQSLYWTSYTLPKILCTREWKFGSN